MSAGRAEEIRQGIRSAVARRETAEAQRESAERDLCRWMAAAQDCADLSMVEAARVAGVGRVTAHSLARQGRGGEPYSRSE